MPKTEENNTVTKNRGGIPHQERYEKLKAYGIRVPQYLDQIGQWHYGKIAIWLKESGIYEEIDSGVIEQAAMAYSKSRDSELDDDIRLKWSKFYSDLMVSFGASVKSRKQLKMAKDKKEHDKYADISEEFFV